MKNNLLNRDYFGNQFRMRLDADSISLNSIGGSVMSIFITIVMIMFAYLKGDVLIQKKDVDILSTINDRHFSDTDQFTYSNGFNIAVAFTGFNSNPEH